MHMRILFSIITLILVILIIIAIYFAATKKSFCDNYARHGKAMDVIGSADEAASNRVYQSELKRCEETYWKIRAHGVYDRLHGIFKK